MEKIILNAEIRNAEEKLKEIKSEKKLAWVIYGKNREVTSLKLDYSEFLKTYRKAWENHIINLKIDKENVEVLVHDVQYHPISWDFIHVDFYAITRWQALITHIPLNFVWTSPAIKEWAILDEHLKEIEVKCLPKNLVDSFDVDLSVLVEMWDTIKVSELVIDKEKFEVLSNENDVVVSASKPAKIEIETPVEASTEEETKTEEK